MEISQNFVAFSEYMNFNAFAVYKENVHVSSIVDTAFMYGVLIISIKQVQVG